MTARVRVAAMDYVAILVHRALSRHRSGEMCPDCPSLCHHCGSVGLPGEDHTCPCPNPDPCPDHPKDPR